MEQSNNKNDTSPPPPPSSLSAVNKQRPRSSQYKHSAKKSQSNTSLTQQDHKKRTRKPHSEGIINQRANKKLKLIQLDANIDVQEEKTESAFTRVKKKDSKRKAAPKKKKLVRKKPGFDDMVDTGDSNNEQEESFSESESSDGEDVAIVDDDDASEGDSDLCKVCAKGDQEEKILLCDGCDSAWHTFCLKLPLSEIPEGDWFCPTCVSGRSDEKPSSSRSTRSRRVTKLRSQPEVGVSVARVTEYAEVEHAHVIDDPVLVDFEATNLKEMPNVDYFLQLSKEDISTAFKELVLMRDSLTQIFVCRILHVNLDDLKPFIRGKKGGLLSAIDIPEENDELFQRMAFWTCFKENRLVSEFDEFLLSTSSSYPVTNYYQEGILNERELSDWRSFKLSFPDRMKFSSRVHAFFSGKKLALLRKCCTVPLDDPRISQLAKFPHRTFKQYFELYVSYFDLNMTTMALWLNVTYSRLYAFLTKGQQEVSASHPVAIACYHFVISQEQFLVDNTKQIVASASEEHRQELMEFLKNVDETFKLNMWFEFDIPFAHRFQFSKIFLVVFKKGLPQSLEILKVSSLFEKEASRPSPVYESIHFGFKGLSVKGLDSVDDDSVKTSSKHKKQLRSKKSTISDVDVSDVSPPCHTFTSQNFQIKLCDLQLIDESLGNFVLPGYNSYSVKVKNETSLVHCFSSAPGNDVSSCKPSLIGSNGPVQFVTFCPEYVSERKSRILAIHSPSDNLYHKIADHAKSNQIVQFWDIPMEEKDPANPQLLMCFIFNRSSISQIKWHPSNNVRMTTSGDILNRIGILAVSFRDGFVGVYSVPEPYELKAKAMFHSEVPLISPTALFCWVPKRSCSTISLDWNRAGSDAFLLSGGSDGTVRLHALYSSKLRDDRVSNLPSLSLLDCQTLNFRCFDDGNPVRSISCSPENKHLFIAGSEQGMLGIWDVRSPNQTLMAFIETGGSPIRTLDWICGVPVIIVGTDSGLRIFGLNDLGTVIRAPFREFNIDDVASQDVKVIQKHDMVHVLVAYDNGSTCLFSADLNCLKVNTSKDSYYGCGQIVSRVESFETEADGTRSLIYQYRGFPARFMRTREECRKVAKEAAANMGNLSFQQVVMAPHHSMLSCDIHFNGPKSVSIATGGRNGIVVVKTNLSIPDAVR